MRVALVSDIHANLPALDAVLTALGGVGLDALWNMGDTVGYGPEPDGVVTRLRAEGAICVMGNHDAAAVGLIDTTEFNPVAAEAAAWTARTLAAETKAYLSGLAKSRVEGNFSLAHGTLADPLWEYLTTVGAARNHFARQTTPTSFVGHTHLPLLIREGKDGHFASRTPDDGEVVELGEGRSCINPGSVGQPRDGDPRASYAVLDTAAGTVTFHRVVYDIATTQVRIRDAGLPEALASRLTRGR